eukprot:702680-Amphidinium_carterae.2
MQALTRVAHRIGVGGNVFARSCYGTLAPHAFVVTDHCKRWRETLTNFERGPSGPAFHGGNSPWSKDTEKMRLH